MESNARKLDVFLPDAGRLHTGATQSVYLDAQNAVFEIAVMQRPHDYAVLTVICALCVWNSSCMPDEQPPETGGCQPQNSTLYGTGSISFGTTKPGSNDTVRVSVTGNYIPSSQFLDDTTSEQG